MKEKRKEKPRKATQERICEVMKSNISFKFTPVFSSFID